MAPYDSVQGDAYPGDSEQEAAARATQARREINRLARQIHRCFDSERTQKLFASRHDALAIMWERKLFNLALHNAAASALATTWCKDETETISVGLSYFLCTAEEIFERLVKAECELLSSRRRGKPLDRKLVRTVLVELLVEDKTRGHDPLVAKARQRYRARRVKTARQMARARKGRRFTKANVKFVKLEPIPEDEYGIVLEPTDLPAEDEVDRRVAASQTLPWVCTIAHDVLPPSLWPAFERMSRSEPAKDEEEERAREQALDVLRKHFRGYTNPL